MLKNTYSSGITPLFLQSIKYRNGKAYGYSYAYDEEGQEIYRTYWLDGDKLTKEDLAKYLEKCRKQGVIPEE